MGFFHDVKQDLSQTGKEISLDAEIAALDEASSSSKDLFGSSDDVFSGMNDMGDMLGGLDKALGKQASNLPLDNEPEDPVTDEQPEALTEAVLETIEKNGKGNEMNGIGEKDAALEQLLNEVEQNVEEPSYIDAARNMDSSQSDFDSSTAASTDTAVITAGMNITGDVISSGNMDLIGSITGNIEIVGKLNVTGSITGNSSAAEIYAESAQINGEIRGKGSVKIGQSSVVIGNIFATSAVIAGAVKGDIDVHGPVILDTSAIVMGNIKSKSVQINNGAVIEGMCSQCYAEISPTSFFNDVKKNRK